MKWASQIFGLTLRRVRQFVVFVMGSTVLLIGIALIVLPGPAFVVIPAGLAILAAEFSWARRMLARARAAAENVLKFPGAAGGGDKGGGSYQNKS